MTIRILGYKDAMQYKKIGLEALANYPTLFNSTYEHEKQMTIQEIEQSLRPQADKFTLGAFDGEKLVGIVSFNREISAKRNHKGHLTGMYVTPVARKQGVARTMLEQLFLLLRKNEELEQLHLTIESSNKQAMALFESLEFQSYAIEKQALKIEGNYYDESWMVKYLS